MKNAIIIHGMPGKEEYYSDQYPSSSNFQWLPWLQKQLLMRDIFAVTPEMPQAYAPVYELWKTEFERFDITPETILVGHSCGGGFLVRWLSEHADVKVGKVVLVAPWLDSKNELQNGFFDFEIDSTLVSRTKSITIFNSTNDFDSIHESVKRIMSMVKDVHYVEFKDKGHFIGEPFITNGFPELLEEILK
jgi:hypothetical protein